MLGTPEVIMIFLAIVLLFGAKKLPELARGLGKGMKEFKKAQNEIEEEFKSTADETQKKDKTPSTDRT